MNIKQIAKNRYRFFAKTRSSKMKRWAYLTMASLLGILLASCADPPVIPSNVYVTILGTQGSYLSSCPATYSRCIGGFVIPQNQSVTPGYVANSDKFSQILGEVPSPGFQVGTDPTWPNPPGVAAYSVATDSKGDVFTGYIPQTGSQDLPTSNQTFISVSKPVLTGSTTGTDPGTTPSQIVTIPTSTGATEAISQNVAGDVAGSDISAISYDSNTQTADFIIAAPYHEQDISSPTNGGYFPQFGQVSFNSSVGWHVSSSLTPPQVAASPDSTLVDPLTSLVAGTPVTYGSEACPTDQVVDAAIQPNYVLSYAPQCREPVAMGQLPYSHDFVVAQYTTPAIPNPFPTKDGTPTGTITDPLGSLGNFNETGAIMLLSESGQLLADFPVAATTADYFGNTFYTIQPRTIAVEPANSQDGTESPNSEHFAVIYDTYHCSTLYASCGGSDGWEMQQWSVNDSKIGGPSNPLQPITQAFTPGDITNSLPSTSSGTASGFTGMTYDNSGDLIATEATSNLGVPTPNIDVYTQASLVSCGGGALGSGSPYNRFNGYGVPCNPTHAVSNLLPGTQTSVVGSGLGSTVVCCSVRGSVFVVSSLGGGRGGGYVVPLNNQTWTLGLGVPLGLDQLTNRCDFNVSFNFGAISQSAGSSYLNLPIATEGFPTGFFFSYTFDGDQAASSFCPPDGSSSDSEITSSGIVTSAYEGLTLFPTQSPVTTPSPMESVNLTDLCAIDAC